MADPVRFTIRVRDSETVDKHTEYKVEVSTQTSAWTLSLRYSVLRAFHEDLTKDDGLNAREIPDFPPKKKLGKRKPAFVEKRRQALDDYMQALLAVTGIRENEAFREFFDLTGGREGVTSTSGGGGSANSQWLVEHRELEADARDIAVALRDRSDAEADGEDVTRINTRIRMRLNAMTESIARLRSELRAMELPDGEMARRRGLLSAVSTRKEDLMQQLRSGGAGTTSTGASGGVAGGGRSRRDQLIGGARPNKRSSMAWGAQETEETRDLDNEQFLMLQRRVMEDQDKGLDQLAAVMDRQVHIARAIGNELDLHNHLLTDLEADVDRTTSSLKRENKRLDKLLK